MAQHKQQRLFDERALSQEHSGVFAQVVFNRPMRTRFIYHVPVDMVQRIAAGKRVLAPFGKGNHRTTGYCVGVVRQPAPECKSLYAVLDDEPLLSDRMLELTQWIADYYYCSAGQVLEAVLPRAAKLKSGTRWTVFLSPRDEEQRPATALTATQRRAFDALVSFGRPATNKEICQNARCGPEVVKALVEKGWATASRQRVFVRPPRLHPVVWDQPLVLNPHQQEAVAAVIAALRAGQAQTFLLHGVTGSGKTEVYLQVIAEAVRHGKEAIVLVPEISLTPQTIERFRQRFDEVAVLHSQLSDADRSWHWQRIAAGEVQVIVGARSALFAPCKNLGLIVIDEEHETTFKQDSTPRYHARDVAIERSKLEGVPLVLGSATPSLETWHAAQTGTVRLLSLPKRVFDLPMPGVGIVDLKAEYKPGVFCALSRPLALAIEQTLKDGGQVILLLNRRGFSTAVLCPQCGYVAKCRHCEIALTFHKEFGHLLCHSCDADFPVPERCPQCRMPAIRYSGIGTERLEEEVRARFAGYSVERMDSDTMRSVAHYEKVLTAFRQGKVQILLGTQMIAKGLDFPNVRLVGVVTADTARHLPDFRASERTFQLIAQVAGRTGRGENRGRVLVQTFNPEDPAILAASRHDYLRFVAKELPLRAQFGYPPFQFLTRVIVRSKLETTARQAAGMLAERLRACLSNDESVRVLGPAPAPVPKLRDFFRMHFQVHTIDAATRQVLLERTFSGVVLPQDAEFTVDVDPVSLV